MFQKPWRGIYFWSSLLGPPARPAQRFHWIFTTHRRVPRQSLRIWFWLPGGFLLIFTKEKRLNLAPSCRPSYPPPHDFRFPHTSHARSSFFIKFSPLPRAPLGDVIDFSPLLRAPLVNFIEFFYPTRAPRQWLRFWFWPPGGSLLDRLNKTIKLQFFSAIVPSHSWRLLPRNTVRATVVNLWGVHATVGQIRTWKTVNSKTMRFSVILSYPISSYPILAYLYLHLYLYYLYLYHYFIFS